jgi:hypothetical protein
MRTHPPRRARTWIVAALILVLLSGVVALGIRGAPSLTSRVERGTWDPKAPPNRIDFRGRHYYPAWLDSTDPFDSMNRTRAADDLPPLDRSLLVRIGTPPSPDRAILVEKSYETTRTPVLIFAELQDGNVVPFGLSGGP